MNTTIYYMTLYVVTLLAALVGAYLHIVPTDIVVGVIGIVLGHGSGLFTQPPGTTNG